MGIAKNAAKAGAQGLLIGAGFELAKQVYTGEKIEQVTTSSVCGLASASKGAAIGAKLLACFGGVGAAVGGFAGGVIGYMAGSGIGTAITKGYQKVRSVVVEHVVKPILNSARKAWEGVKSFASNLFSWW